MNLSRNTLAVYIHWPFCLSKCPYCDFNSHVRERVDHQAWQQALLKELTYFAAQVPGRRVESVFFGGGTPSLMPPATVAALLEAVAMHWKTDENIEITLEANPTSVEAKTFAGFRQAGVNRVSLGVQALEDDALKSLGRHHSVKEALAAVALAAKIFPRYSFDLIYARPGQTIESWEKELKAALEYADGHLSLYQLTIEENTAFHHAYTRGELVLPPEDDAAAMYEHTQVIIESAGMPAYEISNHAKAGQESRHNLAYWRGQEYIGIGPGAHGRIHNGQRLATRTLKSPERWLEAVHKHGHGLENAEPLSLQEAREEQLMMRLRLTEGFPRSEMPFIQSGRIAALQQQGLLEKNEDLIRPTLRGRLLLNYLTAELLG